MTTPAIPRPVSAQRLSASMEGTHKLEPFIAWWGICAQRLSASMEGTLAADFTNSPNLSRCSTPVGINGRNTPCRHACRVSGKCAQRLSASMEGTLGRHGGGHYRFFVLNACRHQWKEHRCVVLRGCDGIHVLNACRHQWKEHGRNAGRILFYGCAQRLSASMEGTHHLLSGTRASGRLCSTPVGINGRNTR